MATPYAMVVVGMLAVTANQPVATTADVAFLTGCWRFERGGRTVEEHWLPPAGGSLLGVSRTVAGGKTVEFEFIQIRAVDDGLAYIAKPSGQPEATFKATSTAPNKIVFENPSHDFPQKITYQLTGETLNAQVEGTTSGKSRRLVFPYTRGGCAP